MNEEPLVIIESSGDSTILNSNSALPLSSSTTVTTTRTSASQTISTPPIDVSLLAPEYSPLRPLSNGASFKEMYQHLLH